MTYLEENPFPFNQLNQLLKVRQLIEDDNRHFEIFKTLCKNSYESVGNSNKMVVVDHCFTSADDDYVFCRPLVTIASEYILVAESFGLVKQTKSLSDYLVNLKEVVKQEVYFGYTSLKDGSMLLRKDVKDPSYFHSPYHNCAFFMVNKKLHAIFQATTMEEIEKNRSSKRPEIRGTGVYEVSTEFKTLVLSRIKSKVNLSVGVVYFLRFPKSNLVKIGFTTNLKTRVSAYETHSAETFKVYKTISGTTEDEKEIHKKLSKFRVKKEFFKWCEEIKNFIDSLE